MSDVVAVEGLAELRRALKTVDAELPKELRRSFLAVGTRIADDARRTVPVRSGRAARSVKAGVSGNTAYVQGGRKTVPYYGWLDFGGQLPSKRSGKRARAVRPRIKEGRYLYPAIRRNRDRTIKETAEALESITERAFR